MTQQSASVTITGEVLACEPAMSAKELFDFALQVAATAIAPTMLSAPDSEVAASTLADLAHGQLTGQLRRILKQEGKA